VYWVGETGRKSANEKWGRWGSGVFTLKPGRGAWDGGHGVWAVVICAERATWVRPRRSGWLQERGRG
jgi:hypothetical protein